MQAKVNDRQSVSMQSSEGGRKEGLRDTSMLSKDLKVLFQDTPLKKRKKGLLIKYLLKQFSHCRQRTGRKRGMYSDQRKHSLREISHINLQRTYLPCLLLNRMSSRTYALSPSSEKSCFLEIFSPKSWEQRAVPRGRGRRSPGSWTEGSAALPVGSGSWNKIIAPTSKQL